MFADPTDKDIYGAKISESVLVQKVGLFFRKIQEWNKSKISIRPLETDTTGTDPAFQTTIVTSTHQLSKLPHTNAIAYANFPTLKFYGGNNTETMIAFDGDTEALLDKYWQLVSQSLIAYIKIKGNQNQEETQFPSLYKMGDILKGNKN